jgi:hypothetical protein
MRALLLSVFSLFALGSNCEAQIIAVHFKTAKATKKFKDHLVEYKGEMVLVGEPKSGVSYDANRNGVDYQGQGSNLLFVVNPKDPTAIPYFLIDGKKKEASKKHVVSVQGKDIAKFSVVMRDQSLPGLCREYAIRVDQLDDFQAARDAEEKGSVSWLAAHRRFVTALERLHGWLASVGYSGALKSIEKQVKKEKKAVRDEGLQARFKTAIDSVAPCDVPEQFVSLSKEISGGRDVFHGYASQHIRLYYLNETARGDQRLISDDEAKHLVELGEEVIEGFRAEFVDPYLDEDYPDYIPDDTIITISFFPSHTENFQSYAGPIYGRRVKPENPDLGGRGFGSVPAHVRFYWQLNDVDLEGILCHGLGHALSSRHFGQGRNNLEQDWLSEAVGNQISYEYLGRNNVTCLGVREKPTYKKREASKPGEKTIAFGRRAVYNQLALEQGSPINQIALKKLYELADADLAKGWSFYDFITRKEGKAGQQWLRAAGQHATRRSSFIQNWREAAAEILGVQQGAAFKVLEERWREYAERDQLKERKKKRR